MPCPDTAVFASSRRPLTRPLTRLAIRSGPPRFLDETETSPAAVEEPLRYRARAIRLPYRCGRVCAACARDSPPDVATCHRVVRRRTRSLMMMN